MNWKTWAPLVLAVVFAVMAAKAVHDWMLKNQRVAAPAGHTVKVVVARADVQPGKELKAEDLTLADVPAEIAPASGFKTLEEVAGRVSETLMVKGQPVVEAQLAPTGSGSGLQALVQPGMRAVTIEVNEFSGVAGLLSPGCHVDILATINNGEQGGQLAKTIVQNVKVQAVGQRTGAAGPDQPPAQQPNEIARSVTVLCTLADAEAIELACATGRPRLVLRSGRDSQVVATPGISLGELRGGPIGDTALAAAPSTTQPSPTAIATATTQPSVESPVDTVVRSEPPRRTVKIIRGGQESTVTMSVVTDGTDGDTAVTDTSSDQADPFKGE
jgi:pilus assembly protein CpaB